MTKQDPNVLASRLDSNNGPVLHVRFEGQSRDIPLESLRIGTGSSDQAIKISVANHLDVAVERFDSMVIERHPNGNLTMRPEAVFG